MASAQAAVDGTLAYPGDDPSSVAQYAQDLLDARAGMARTWDYLNDAGSQLNAHWRSDAKTAAEGEVATLTSASLAVARRLQQAVDALTPYHQTLLTARSQIDELRSQWVSYAAQGDDPHADQVALKLNFQGLGGQHALIVEKVKRAADAASATLTSISGGGSAAGLGQATGISGLQMDDRIQSDQNTSPAVAWANLSDAEKKFYRGLAGGVPTGSAAQVKTAWDGLAPMTQYSLVLDQTKQVGSTGGIPVVWRSQANTLLLNADVTETTTKLQALGVPATSAGVQQLIDRYGKAQLYRGPAVASPGPYSMAELKTMKAQLDTAEGMQQGTTRTGAPTYLMVYDPSAFGGDGRVAIAVGNPDTADNVAVSVPGITNSAGDRMTSTDPTNLYITANKASSSTTAVINWMGYDAPGAIPDPGTMSDNMAKDGAKLLTTDVSALRVDNPSAKLTVVAHSYGSTTTGYALMGGMNKDVDQVVVIGSPGMGVDANGNNVASTAQLGLRSDQFYVGHAPDDPIAGDMDYHGNKPGTGEFNGGSTFFTTHTDTSLDDHSHYYDGHSNGSGQWVASESLANIADIVSGNGLKPKESAGPLVPTFGPPLIPWLSPTPSVRWTSAKPHTPYDVVYH